LSFPGNGAIFRKLTLSRSNAIFGLGTSELIIILILVLIIFGAGKLPQVGKSLGQGLRNFKDGMKEGEKSDSDKNEIDNQNKP
jgi:sec-independent protein translocase protein TatA